LAAWGFGENRPVIENDSFEHRAQNRRIEVVILKKKQTA
jgi:flagellar motor protein MotB